MGQREKGEEEKKKKKERDILDPRCLLIGLSA
jgi:hypothetical protein